MFLVEAVDLAIVNQRQASFYEYENLKNLFALQNLLL